MTIKEWCEKYRTEKDIDELRYFLEMIEKLYNNNFSMRDTDILCYNYLLNDIDAEHQLIINDKSYMLNFELYDFFYILFQNIKFDLLCVVDEDEDFKNFELQIEKLLNKIKEINYE